MRNGFLFALSFMTLVLFSCKKDDDDTKTPVTNTDLVTTSSWKYDNAGVDTDNNGTGETPIPSDLLEDCDKDNTITFASDGTGVADEGPTKCEDALPQSTPFTWTFTGNETKINFTGEVFAGLDGEATIVSLTNTTLVLSKETEYLGFNVHVIITLKH